MADPSHHNDGVLDDIVELLDRVAVRGSQRIEPTTELYYDLGLSGDDLYDAIVAIRAQFGTDFSNLDLRDYAPGEVEGLFSFDLLFGLFNRSRGRYRSLTVQSLIEAIDKGAWSPN